MTPAGASERPVGRLPLARDHTYGLVPPEAARANEYEKDCPTSAAGRVVVVMDGVVLTVMENSFVTVTLSASVTLIVKLTGFGPFMVGIPLIVLV